MADKTKFQEEEMTLLNAHYKQQYKSLMEAVADKIGLEYEKMKDPVYISKLEVEQAKKQEAEAKRQAVFGDPWNEHLWGTVNNLECLIGKEVDKVFMAGDTYIVFEFTNGKYLTFHADADCCSESWIEHISGIKALKDGIITKVEELDLGSCIPTRQESDQLYGVKIHLKARPDKTIWEPYFYIEFRNSSNGYYGGDLKRVRTLKEELHGLREIKEDE